MSTDISRAEYWNEVHEIAQGAIDEVVPFLPLEENEDDIREKLEEYVGNTLDTHQWVIYTCYNFDVLKHSDNSGYYFDHHGPDGLVEGGQLRFDRLAVFALYGDVMEKLNAMLDDIDFHDRYDVVEMIVEFVKEKRRNNGATEEELEDLDEDDAEVQRYLEELTENPRNMCDETIKKEFEAHLDSLV